MLITDVNELYTLKLDSSRNICYETPVGLWSKEDYMRYHNDYVTKIGPAVKGKKWAKFVDLRKYKVSDISAEIQMHVEWMLNNGVSTIAVLVDSAIAKMQMNRAGGGNFEQQAFTDEKEADAWLKSKGF